MLKEIKINFKNSMDYSLILEKGYIFIYRFDIQIIL